MMGTGLVLTTVSALGCAVAAGVLFSFSAFVMRALAGLPPEQGIAAMQSINLAALRPGLMIEVFGTAAACVAACVVTLLSSDAAAQLLVGAGTLTYLLGTVGLTGRYHQPRNLELARVDPSAPDSPVRWKRYVAGWTTGNHLRTGASLLAAILLSNGARYV
jgi:uncharacterized membrane protein